MVVSSNNLIICKKCGIKNNFFSEHCKNCGAELGLKICPKCGKGKLEWKDKLYGLIPGHLRDSGVWCPSCGYTFATKKGVRVGGRGGRIHKPVGESIKKDAFRKKEMEEKLFTPEVTRLAEKYSYMKIIKLAKKHNISSGSKGKMIMSLLEKGIKIE